MAVHSLDWCLPETGGDVRSWQYTVWIDCCLSETDGDVRPWQYTVWTGVCPGLQLEQLIGNFIIVRKKREGGTWSSAPPPGETGRT